MASHTKPGDYGRVLITGVRGFTGRYLKDELTRHGYSVHGTIISSDAQPGEWTMDLCDPDSVRRVVQAVCPEYVIHLAAVSFVQHEPAIDFYRTNVLGAVDFIDALANLPQPPRKVVVASSANIYGNAPVSPVSETCPPAPVNHYSASKLVMEHLIRARSDHIPIIIVRPFNYTGVGQEKHFLVPKVVGHFKAGSSYIELGNLEIERDFSDVRTVASIYRRLLECDALDETVNIASGRAISLREIITTLTELTGHEIEIRVNPAFVRGAEVRTLVGSAKKLLGLIGPIELSSMRETLRWMLDASPTSDTF